MRAQDWVWALGRNRDGQPGGLTVRVGQREALHAITSGAALDAFTERSLAYKTQQQLRMPAMLTIRWKLLCSHLPLHGTQACRHAQSW